jgi:hypothetical protein
LEFDEFNLETIQLLFSLSYLKNRNKEERFIDLISNMQHQKVRKNVWIKNIEKEKKKTKPGRTNE